MNRKGITPVIAIVLLLMMTVAAAGLAYSWIMSMQETAQAGISEDISARMETMRAGITIISVWQTGATPDTGISMAIKNSGSSTFQDAEIDDFQVFVDGKPPTTGGCLADSDIGPGKTFTCTHDAAFPGSGESVTIRVSPTVGNAVSYVCSIPTGSAQTYC